MLENFRKTLSKKSETSVAYLFHQYKLAYKVLVSFVEYLQRYSKNSKKLLKKISAILKNLLILLNGVGLCLGLNIVRKEIRKPFQQYIIFNIKVF